MFNKRKKIDSDREGEGTLIVNKYDSRGQEPITPKRRRKAWILFIIVGLIFLPVSFFVWKTVQGANKITVGGGEGFFSSLTNILTDKKLKGESDDRINILLLGMRGADYTDGGTLSDSIMVISYKPSNKQVAMISVPRDLFVAIPGGDKKLRKINSIHAIGEAKGKDKGMEYMATTVASVLDIPIHYTIKIDFTSFKQIINAVGGVDIYLDEPFSEPTQFDNKKFYLPAGKNHLDGDKASAYVQARFASSDFDRARRQQQVIKAVKEKAVSVGFLSNPTKINNLINAVSDHVRTDMKASEITKFVKITSEVNLGEAKQFVFDTSERGLLFQTYIDDAYALRPIKNDFTKMREKAKNIFDEKS